MLEVNGKHLRNAAPIRFGFIDNIWRVDSFALASLEGRTVGSPFVTCRLTMDGESLDLTAESRGFQLEPLCAALNLPADVTGSASYKLTGGGSLTNPELALEWAIPELRVENAPVPVVVREASGRARFSDHTLKVEPFNFLLMGVPVEAEATASVDISDLQSSSVNLRMSIADFDLGSMDAGSFFEGMDDRQFPVVLSTEGQLNFGAHLSGAFSDPTLQTSIGVTGAKVHVLDYPQPLENINLDLRVVGGDVTSDKLLSVFADAATWQIGEGHYKATGDWGLPRTEAQHSLAALSRRPPNSIHLFNLSSMGRARV